MNLQQIIERLFEINNRMAAIQKEAQNKETTNERMAELDTEVEMLAQERTNLTAEKVRLLSQATSFRSIVDKQESDKFDETATEERDLYNSIEYRRAFMDLVMRHKDSPILHRADESTLQDGNKAVIIPTTITNRMFEKNGNEGSIFARVTKTAYSVGAAVPLINFKPELEWVSENSKSSRTKATSTSITFNGYKCQIRLAISLETQVKSLEQFEAALLDRIMKACARGFDKVIVSGDGQGKPTGIIAGADYSKKSTKMSSKQVGDYAEWIKAWAKISLNGQKTTQLHINKVDWQSKVLGMKDSTGKVIALETMGFGGVLKPMFMGREVVLLENQGLPAFDSITGAATASKATAFAYFVNDDDYMFNSNLQLTLRSYIDEETDEKIHKATGIADGKLVDDESLLVICRGVDA